MTRWQYRTLKVDAEGCFRGGGVDAEDLDARLNELGAEGWEAVSAFDTNQVKGATRFIVVLLKRPAEG